MNFELQIQTDLDEIIRFTTGRKIILKSDLGKMVVRIASDPSLDYSLHNLVSFG